MANEKGVWRTIGGRRVFIKEGQDLATAMKESGKFKSASKGAKKEMTEEEKAKRINETMDRRSEVIDRLDKETYGLDNYDRYNLALSKLENKEGMRPMERQYWAGIKERYEKNQKANKETKNDPYDDPESEESQRLHYIQSRYDEYLQATEGRGASYGELAHIESLRGKELDDFEKELDNFEESDLDKVKRIQSNLDKKGDKLTKEEKAWKEQLANTQKELESGKSREDIIKDLDREALRNAEKEYGELSKKMQADDYYYKPEDDRKLKELRAKADSERARQGIDTQEKYDKLMSEDSNKKEQFSVSELKKKAQATLPKEDIDTHEGDLYLKKTKESTELLNNMKDKDNGLLTTFKDQETGETWYDIPFANMGDDYKEKYKHSFPFHEKTEKEKKYAEEVAEYYKDKDIKQEIAKAKKEAEKSTNDIMNEKIRSRGKSKVEEDDLPKRTEIKTQGTSNRKEVSDNIQAHILDYYTEDYTGENISPSEAFVRQMDAMGESNMWRAGQKIAEGGSYLIYNSDMADFLDELKINPKGKTFSEDKAFDMYTSLIGRESAKLYDRIQKNSYKKYMKAHPLSKMSFEEFKDMNKK